MAALKIKKILSGLRAQREGVNASDIVNERLTPQNIVIFSKEVHVAANMNLCTVKFYLL